MASTDVVEDLIPRAEIFRSKLIEDFQLLDSINKTTIEAPKYYSSELSDSEECMAKMLKECPHTVVKFQVYTTKVETAYDDRRLNRVKTRNTIPFGPWARMMVENSYVQNFLLVLILLNSIVLGVQAEITHIEDESYDSIKLFLDIFDYLSMMVFVMEILLKWVDGFWQFWSNGWNNFDFLVTVMSLVPEIMKLLSGQQTTEELAVIAENLRVFRILRSLKMVSRFAQLRIIVLTILKAFKSMVFILTLLIVFMYIFAVAGTVMFDSFSKSTRTDLVYKESFSTLGNSLVTLFQLFTLDHWFEVLIDLNKVQSGLISKSFIILWICIGAFIFRNIFAGIMVMNFQNIRSDFIQQCNEREMEMEKDKQEQLLDLELATQYERHSTARQCTATSLTAFEPRSHPTALPQIIEEDVNNKFITSRDVKDKPSTDAGADSPSVRSAENVNSSSEMKNESSAPPSIAEMEMMKAALSQMLGSVKQDFPESSSWNNAVQLNLQNFSNSLKETLWPRDLLFRYFRLMEALQDNLAERQQLQRLAVLALSNILEESSAP